MIARLAVSMRRLRRRFTRSYWELRLMPLSKSEGTSSSRGLIMIQIDGLSHPQMRRAVREGHMPFLEKLIEKENYEEYSHYSGLPSATPGVQGELFYGVKSCVPAFHFYDRKTSQMFTMYDAKSASEIEKQMARENRGLLEEGSSYSNIFSGGAKESHFCCATFGWQGFFKLLNPMSWTALFIFHLDILIKTLFLLVIELGLSIVDCIRGMLKGQYFFYEAQFILTRVFICVLLRELIVLGARIDIARGLPVIHVNFFGYDEQSHRRGPSSAFAHWCLRGIDAAVAQLWREARLADRREYDIWIYSDHGQEDTAPYHKLHHENIQDVLDGIFSKAAAQNPARARMGHGPSCCYAGRYYPARPSRGERDAPRNSPAPAPAPASHTAETETQTPDVIAAGMGPLCHVYSKIPLGHDERIKLAHDILVKAEVPLVLIPDEGRNALAITASGTYNLPRDASDVLGHDHPFLEEAAHDLAELCHHPYSGDLILSGWLANRKPITFPIENGSHAGIGAEETHGFALLPQDTPLPERSREYLRPSILREAALRVLGRSESVVSRETRQADVVPKTLRVACYNVHGCLGMDGKRSTDRIARVIARYSPDAIALQELDAGCKRSQEIHQAEAIAERLRMTFQFYPSFCLNGHYGNGILSHYPMRQVKVGGLPQLYKRKEFEPRGALWVELDLGGGTQVQIITTHLSLWPQERLLQTEALLGPEWLGSPLCKPPVILCGDFNSSPASQVYKRITTRLQDAQMLLEFHRPYGTWLRSYSFTRIDHMFISPDIKVTRIVVPSTELDKVASDHFPLFIDLVVSGRAARVPEHGQALGAAKAGSAGKEFSEGFVNKSEQE
ncbi:MAG TPA: endonuclease/exonuclease/phosphatase family protein [Verrucomicrobiae bacterium]|nr:endonuclease/exonuclease/phosphatase family protein [Verrucomicrobiae bacterium]